MIQRLFRRFTLSVARLATLVGLLAIGLTVTPAHGQAPQQLVDIAGGAYNGIEVTLRADRSPLPGEVATFQVSATPLRPAPELTITWALPDGGELLGGGAITTLGGFNAGETAAQTRQVQFPRAGVYTVRVQATYQPNAATTLTAVGVLFFDVRAEGTRVSDVDPRTPIYVAPAARPTVDKRHLVVAADAWGPDIPDGCFAVTGFLTREERQPLANPPRYVDQLGSAVPVRNMLVEMREEDTISDDSYGHTVTDANGRFDFHFCDDDGVLNDELELYYRVCAEVWEGPNKIARIEHLGERELYCFDSRIIDSEGGTVDFDLQVFTINSIEAQVFNIGHSLYWAWRYWNNNLGAGAPFFDRAVTVFWEAGKGNGSFYNDTRGAMVIAGDASSADQWDDSVIIHEWGHFADHQFSCNQNPGGAHTLPGMNTGTNGDKLSWGEGFPDFYQSAARTIMPGSPNVNFYIDVSGPTVDFETLPGTASPLNEGAVAALLWDFIDSTNDGSDTVTHGMDRVLRAYTAPDFRGNAQCNMARYLRVWRDLSFPTDAATAATVVQNVNISAPFAASMAASGEPLLSTASLAASNAAAPPYDYRWWDQVTMVVDASISMASPAGTPKIEAVKSLLREQVNDLARNPRGTEHHLYTFNALTPLTPIAKGLFFPHQLDPVINALAANEADYGCPTNTLLAMAKAAQGTYDGQVWAYTDGESNTTAFVEHTRQQLTDRLLRGSIVLLGGCGTPPTTQSQVTDVEKGYLGLAADGSQNAGIVPYLLTALGTGGNFLYVPPDQLANAVDILRAQASHSAGAGKWSDYVSDRHTYRWDRLEASEYAWIDPNVGGTYLGNPSAAAIQVNLPQPFSVYGQLTSIAWANSQGYLLMDSALDAPTLDILYGNLEWYWPGPRAQEVAPAAVDQLSVFVYSQQAGDWFAITTTGRRTFNENREFQALLNLNTGEIRYQYKAVSPVDTAVAQIAITDVRNNQRVVVSNQDLGGAASGSGYKFTPAPPQPTKTYTVAVDSQIQSIGFLQTGYSGSFAPMLVHYPDGTAVDCAETDRVICLSLNGGLVQYVQANINGQTGTWQATIDAGATGEGTFSFTAMAASPIQPKGLSKHTRSVNEQRFRIDLGGSTDDGLLAGWFQSGAGRGFGSQVMFHDDGLHDDELAGDGIFGSDGFAPPTGGLAYLWLQGQIDGETVTRSDPAPYNFQPLDVVAEVPEVEGFLGSLVEIPFLVTNLDAVLRCYFAEVNAPAEWGVDPVNSFCVNPGATERVSVTLTRVLGEQPGGEIGEVSITFTEINQGVIVGGDKATVRLFRPIMGFAFDNPWQVIPLRPNGSDTAPMSIYMVDDQSAVSGRTINLGYTISSTLGTVVGHPDGLFLSGRMPVTLTAGTETGTALIQAMVEGVPLSTSVPIQSPQVAALTLTATPTDLRGADAAALVATVRDDWGDPLSGRTIRLSVSDDDGSQGTLNGSEVYTGTSDANGQVIVSFRKGSQPTGQVAVQAEVLAADSRVTHSALVVVRLTDAVVSEESQLYLPLIRR